MGHLFRRPAPDPSMILPCRDILLAWRDPSSARVIESEALTVISSNTQNVANTADNNSHVPIAINYTYHYGFAPQQVAIEDTGGNAISLVVWAPLSRGVKADAGDGDESLAFMPYR